MIPTSLKPRRLATLGDSFRKLPFPASPKLRIAQVSSGECFDGVKQIEQPDWPELEGYGPRVLVGTGADLQKLAKWSDRGVVALTSLDHAIFVITICGQQPLSDVLRVVLWQTFGVPVYELYVASNGAIIAAECAAQDGWHIQQGAEFFHYSGELHVTVDKQTIRTGLTAKIHAEACPCGLVGSRLTNIEKFQDLAVIHQLAATA